MNKEMIEVFRKFTLLEKLVCFIDLFINPKATDYPIATFQGDFTFNELKKLSGFIFLIKRTGNKVLYIRYKK